jgi:mannose-1-phosphate guanylyltransferase
MKPVIICGGVGTKMWPMSRPEIPKHFLPLIGGKSLFEITWESLRKKFEAKDIFLQTNEKQAQIAKKMVSEILADNIFIEPEMRNHGPATGMTAAMLLKKGFGDEPFMLIQVDDIREPEEKLFTMMDICDRLACETGKYITGGIRPEYAVMGVDYLIKGERVSQEDEAAVFEVNKFLWRSTKEAAEGYVRDGLALIHANHTCMTPKAFMEMYKKYKVEWYEPLMKIVEGAEIAAEYIKMPKGPIEDVTQLVYADGGALVVELPFNWHDIGTWESADRFLKAKSLYQAPKGLIDLDNKDNFVAVPEGKTVALIGVEDLVVVDTEDALLVCRKDQSGRVGEVVERLKLGK